MTGRLTAIFLRSRTHEELRDINLAGGMDERVSMTGDAAFDKAINDPRTGYLGTGNVSSPTQRSFYVRARETTRCNGREWPEGDLRHADLRNFNHAAQAFFHEHQDRLEPGSDAILYEFFVSRADGKRVLRGHVLTDEFHRLVAAEAASPRYADMLERVTRAVSFRDDAMEDPVPAAELLGIARGASAEDAVRFGDEHGMVIRDRGDGRFTVRPVNAVNEGDEADPAYFASVQMFARGPEEAIAVGAIRRGLSPDDLRAALRGLSADDSPAP
ncbi:MAG: hypothetical protein DI629_20825 [Mesorhizobium amorphae]|nr:MAG: hypothetical protein DI629_20825 [Mesorhizobium amorphae]